ncbi:transposase [Microbacterium sp. NPDC060132]|uniref:transposase n=1 Tax=unclassified Microbacterium TaxID=2609290 RepID=UPI0036649FBF
MAASTFDEIVADLYAASPGDFVAARTARAKDTADAATAAAVRELRKPSVAAWVVNVFARERAEQLGEELSLAAELREAQADLDAAALAKLGRERRALTRRLAQAAGQLAQSRGERVTTATLDAVEQTISAAFFDPDAAAAVASGRLLRALEPNASGDDVREAVAGEVPTLAPAAPRRADELSARRARREAERRVTAAEKELAAAERAVAKQDDVLRTLRARAEELDDDIADLEAQLAQLRTEAERIAGELPGATERQEEAVASRDEAARDREAAQRALDAL